MFWNPPLDICISDRQGQGTIVNDDDPPPTFSIDDVSVVEGDSGTNDVTFVFELDRPSDRMSTIFVHGGHGTAGGCAPRCGASARSCPTDGVVRFERSSLRAASMASLRPERSPVSATFSPSAKALYGSVAARGWSALLPPS